ncbi:MAG: hypothetical protein P4L73_20040 [Caulobacteraceae bacterium]|nr:hypothetical protein [Caulobacteraceae bacterium]
MLKWFQALTPRKDRFFPPFNQHAATVVLGAEAVRAPPMAGLAATLFHGLARMV